jgi:hypothetical protein
MIGQFEELLAALGKVFHLKLHIDQTNACCIQVHEGLSIQLQLDVAQENLWIFSKIGEIPPGKFRENVLKETLKANGLPDPRIAAFGLIASTNTLALFQKHPLSILNGEKLSGFIGTHLIMVSSWQTALANGRAVPIEQKETNPFGLK